MNGKFYILDSETPSESTPLPPLNSMSAVGPFDTVRDAENYLREDGADTYLSADKSLRECADGQFWAVPVMIVQVVKTVLQVPVVSVSVKLKTIKP